MNTIKLHNGVEMPCIGLGTYPIFGDQLKQTVLSAYDAGYRLIDTADNYYNEEDLGNSLSNLYKKRGNVRNDMFLVTKISDELYRQGDITPGMNRGIYFWKSSPYMQAPNACHDIVNKKVEDSLRFLKTDFIDLILMHRPYPDFFEEIWYEMEQLYKEGKVRAIGLCNSYERHLDTLLCKGIIAPMVNQVETSPLNTKSEVIEYYASKGVKTMVYSPLQTLKYKNENNYQEYLEQLANKYGKNKGQIILKYNVQRGLIPIPKSTNSKRLALNIDVFDFELTSEEFNNLTSFNKDLQYLPESKGCPGF
ncbi:MAG: aldo/keto reductase [Paludibacteraceae bacterium]|nr:aldo/keto reductase [Paludibacteraceae bacterium]